MILLTLSRLTSRQTHQRGPEIEIRTDLVPARPFYTNHSEYGWIKSGLY